MSGSREGRYSCMSTNLSQVNPFIFHWPVVKLECESRFSIVIDGDVFILCGPFRLLS